MYCWIWILLCWWVIYLQISLWWRLKEFIRGMWWWKSIQWGWLFFNLLNRDKQSMQRKIFKVLLGYIPIYVKFILGYLSSKLYSNYTLFIRHSRKLRLRDVDQCKCQLNMLSSNHHRRHWQWALIEFHMTINQIIRPQHHKFKCYNWLGF